MINEDLSNSSNVPVNFFDNEAYDESESSLIIYEILTLSLWDNDLNHDVQFVWFL